MEGVVEGWYKDGEEGGERRVGRKGSRGEKEGIGVGM